MEKNSGKVVISPRSFIWIFFALAIKIVFLSVYIFMAVTLPLDLTIKILEGILALAIFSALAYRDSKILNKIWNSEGINGLSLWIIIQTVLPLLYYGMITVFKLSNEGIVIMLATSYTAGVMVGEMHFFIKSSGYQRWRRN